MKKSIFIFAIYSLISFANAAWYSTGADGNWSDASTWKNYEIPDSTTDTGIDLYNKVILDTETTVGNIFMKPIDAPTYIAIVDGGKLNANAVANDGNADARFILESGGTLVINTFNSNAIVDFAGGKLETSQNINTGNNVSWTFGANDTNGNFVAAVANSSYAPNKQNFNATTNFRFNLANSNLLNANDETTLLENAFIRSDNEIEFHNSGDVYPQALLDFSNIDLSVLEVGVEYTVSLIGMAKVNYHKDVEPVFSYIVEEDSKIAMTYGETYFYNDLEFSINRDSNYKYYYLTMTYVPEPSTYAAIFGVSALLFVAYRRRK